MAKWIGVVTNAGAELLRGWGTGETLTITGAEAGAGTVPEAALLAQTGVTGGGRQASLVGRKKLDKAVQLRIQIAAPAGEGYTLHQLGIWAALDGETTVLLALYQNQEGVSIPSRTETPDFVYTFYASVALDNSGIIAITTDINAWVTAETLTEAVGEVKIELTAEITKAKGQAITAAGEATDSKIAAHNLAASAHAEQIAEAKGQAITAAEVATDSKIAAHNLAAGAHAEQIAEAKGQAITAAEEATDGKIAAHNLAANAHAGQIAEAVRDAIDRLTHAIMTNEVTLPLATSGGEPLLTASGTPIQAVYHPQK